MLGWSAALCVCRCRLQRLDVAIICHLASRRTSWLCSIPAGEQVSAERLRGALELVVSGLVDRAFATQTAYVHCAHGLSKQAQALTSLNTHLMSVRQVLFLLSAPFLPSPMSLVYRLVCATTTARQFGMPSMSSVQPQLMHERHT